MAVQPNVDDSFTFVGGLHTEGGFFVTPKNTWKDGDNVIPSTDGSIIRRKALDYEENYNLYAGLIYPAELQYSAYSVNKWETVEGNANLEFLVVQEGTKIYFYSSASGAVSGRKKSFSIDLNDFQAFGNDDPNRAQPFGSALITTASCYGKLLITSVDTMPIVVAYDVTNDTIVVDSLEILIRDFEGIPSSQENTAELTFEQWRDLTPSQWPHVLYNLYNQGWSNAHINTYVSFTSNKYPANSKQWIYGKDTAGDFSVTKLNQQDFGTSDAPRGRFVLDAFYQDRGAAAAPVAALGFLTITSSLPTEPNIYGTSLWSAAHGWNRA